MALIYNPQVLSRPVLSRAHTPRAAEHCSESAASRSEKIRATPAFSASALLRLYKSLYGWSRRYRTTLTGRVAALPREVVRSSVYRESWPPDKCHLAFRRKE